MKKKKIVILFTRLSDYMLNVFEHWVDSSNVELYIFRRAVDMEEAPFEFINRYKGIFLFDEHKFNNDLLLKKVVEIDPDTILCAGWMDKRYLNVVSHFSGKIPTVMSMDTQWHGKPRQYIAMIASRLFLRDRFSFIWVPGDPQVRYARKLGFQREQILKGFYVANYNNCALSLINPNRMFKKRFLFVGRYVDIKGLKDLWKAFEAFQNRESSEWELYCVGTGPLFEERMIHPKIKHFGFVQPKDLTNFMAEGGVFILPSHYEPWGVVVHEFALAGFPMIVSDAVGAATAFIDEGNGVIFKSGDIGGLEDAMIEFSQKNKKELESMGSRSYKKALQINEKQWIRTANSILNGGK